MSKIKGLHEYIAENENKKFLLSDPENEYLIPHIRELVEKHDEEVKEQEYAKAKNFAMTYIAENADKIPILPGRRKRVIVINKWFDIFIFQSIMEAADGIHITKKSVMKALEEKRAVRDYYAFYID